MKSLMGEGDAGFGTGSAAELRHLTPRQLDQVRERMARERALAEPAGFIGAANELDVTDMECIGTEEAGTFNSADIERMASEGLVVISVGFGQAVFSRKKSD